MNLLIISTVPFRRTGIPVAIMNNYRLFNHSDIRCTFITYGCVDKLYEKEILKNGDEIFIFPHRTKNTLLYIRKLRKFSKHKKYDIAHIHGNSSSMVFELLALKGNVKTICQAHNTNCVHSKLHNFLYPLFINMVEEKAACTEEAGNFLYRGSAFKVLKNGVNSSDYKFSNDVRRTVRENMKVDKEFVLLHVGGFTKQKNHKFLIELFKLYYQKNSFARLWLIGDGENRIPIMDLVREYNLDKAVKFIGRTDKVAKYMMAADCFVLPSLYESFGIVNIEAQATGLSCIVSTSVPDAAKISENFYKVPLNDKERWIEIIECCRKLVIHRSDSYLNVLNNGFDVSQTSEELMNYYKSL